MKARTRHKVEMGRRALIFCQLEADPSNGYRNALARLEQCLVQANEMIVLQTSSLNAEHVVADQKKKLMHTMRCTHLALLKRAARIAQREDPTVIHAFVLWRGTIPYIEFLSLASSMADAARERQELLVRHGLSETMLENLERLVGEFRELVQQGIDARRGHVVATATLDVLGDDIVRYVKVMDPVHRHRFAQEPGRLAAWASASNVVVIHRNDEPLEPAA